MLTKILAASALTIGLATAAMAQNADTDPTTNINRTTPANPSADDMQMAPDTGITGSITPDGTATVDPNCPAPPLVQQPGAPTTPDTPRTSTPALNNGNNC